MKIFEKTKRILKFFSLTFNDVPLIKNKCAEKGFVSLLVQSSLKEQGEFLILLKEFVDINFNQILTSKKDIIKKNKNFLVKNPKMGSLNFQLIYSTDFYLDLVDVRRLVKNQIFYLQKAQYSVNDIYNLLAGMEVKQFLKRNGIEKEIWVREKPHHNFFKLNHSGFSLEKANTNQENPDLYIFDFFNLYKDGVYCPHLKKNFEELTEEEILILGRFYDFKSGTFSYKGNIMFFSREELEDKFEVYISNVKEMVLNKGFTNIVNQITDIQKNKNMSIFDKNVAIQGIILKNNHSFPKDLNPSLFIAVEKKTNYITLNKKVFDIDTTGNDVYKILVKAAIGSREVLMNSPFVGQRMKDAIQQQTKVEPIFNDIDIDTVD